MNIGELFLEEIDRIRNLPEDERIRAAFAIWADGRAEIQIDEVVRLVKLVWTPPATTQA